jgi:hypothetical protein
MVVLPIYWTLNKRKRALSLNVYRNTHFRTLNTLKQEYSALVKSQVSGKADNPISLHVKFYPKTLSQDMDNFTSVAIKFTLDALVEA